MSDKHKQVSVRSADLIDVIGRALTHEGVTFVPILANVHDIPERLSFWLSEAAPNLATPCQSDWDLDVDDPSALFVRAAIPALFGFTPPHVSDDRDALLDLAFAAGLDSNVDVLIPFVCSDGQLDAGIAFPDGLVPSEVQARIASAFWSLMRRAPHDLTDFDADRISWCHPDGYNTQVRVGLRTGSYYIFDMRPTSE